MSYLISKHREVIYENWRSVSSAIQIPWSHISNTRGSVSSDIQTLTEYINYDKECFILYPNSIISNIRSVHPGVSSDIQTPRSNILNKRSSVSSDIQTPRRNYGIEHEKVCVAAKIYTPRDNRLNTRKSVSSDIQTPRSNLYHKPEGVFHLISKYRKVIG